MAFLPNDRFQKTGFLFFLIFFAGSCINPPYLQFLLMQHVPTLASLALLVFVVNRVEVSRWSYCLTLVFLVLHTIGARYLYSYTPYDDFFAALTGRSLSSLFGWERNHFDRFVHFSFGLLMSVPVQELEQRSLGLSRRMSCLLAIEFVIAMSANYEMVEWLVAVFFAPDWADSFLGQQGDPFDGQKDMALATVGAICSMSLVGLFGPKERRAGSAPTGAPRCRM